MVVMNTKMFKILKTVIALIVLLIVFYIAFMSPLQNLITLENITSIVNEFGIWGPLIFMLMYIVGLLVFVPASLFTIAGGFLFGLWWGVFYVVIAATISAGLGFIISRKFSSKWNFTTSNKLTTRIVSTCEEQCKKNGLQTFVILRLLYLPYMALSYACGVVKTAKLGDFLLATFLTNIVGSFSFAYFGSQLNAGWKALILPVMLIILTFFVPMIVKKFQKKKLTYMSDDKMEIKE